MKKIVKILSIFVFALCVFIVASCGEKTPTSDPVTETPVETPTEGQTPTEEPTVTPTPEEPQFYSVTVKAISGKPMKDFIVSFYLDNKLVVEDFTDTKGEVTFELEANTYTVLIEAEEGYELLQDRYVTDLYYTPIVATCTTYLIEHEAPNGNEYTLGEAMYDFTLTDAYGKEFNLKTLLEEKEAVFLNFWYTDCYYCYTEFPSMNTAYNSSYINANGEEIPYKDDIVILGINYGYDTPEEIESFKLNNNLDIDLMLDYNLTPDGDFTPALTRMFNVTGFPTTIVIDRYGSIAYNYEGGIDEVNKWTAMFDQYIDPDYVPVYTGGEEEEGSVQVEPDIEFPDSSVLEAVASGTNHDGTKFDSEYLPEDNEKDAKYSWPWVVSEDGDSIVPTNSGYHGSFAIFYINVSLKAGEALAFDYFASCENYDVLYVVCNGVLVSQISGLSPEWESCYPYVALEDEECEIGFCYIKDGSSHEWDDKVYVRNIRKILSSQIDEECYIFRDAASGEPNLWNYIYPNYITPVFNENDGYYHVGTAEGAILFADLLSGTKWNNTSIYELAIAGKLVLSDGTDYNEFISTYAMYANNSTIGYVPVTEELKLALEAITYDLGHENAKTNPNQWLETCCYFSVYGPNPKEVEDPVKGVAPFSPLEFDENNSGVATFDRIIVPRGLAFIFEPTVSGVYKFYSVGELPTECWVFDHNLNWISEGDKYTRDHYKSLSGGKEDPNFISYGYYEAGQTYFIRVGFSDIYEFSDLYVKYEYVSASSEILTLASPGYFTSSDDEMSDIIAGGVDVYLDTDGYYHVEGSKSTDTFIYCDVTYYNDIFFRSVQDVLKLGGFNGTIDENGNSCVTPEGYFFYTEDVNEDGIITEDEIFLIIGDDGTPIKAYDYTEYVTQYINENLITDTESELYGCVKVDKDFAVALQAVMDKYTFFGVENSWTKLCYYYKYLGE